MFNYDLEKLTVPKAFRFIALAFTSLIAPLWYVFQFYHPLYLNSDLSKLMIIGLAIGMPILMANFVLEFLFVSTMYQLEKPNEEKISKDAFFYEVIDRAIVNTFMVLYGPIVFGYFIGFEKIKDGPIESSFYIQIGIVSNLAVRLFSTRRAAKKKVNAKKEPEVLPDQSSSPSSGES